VGILTRTVRVGFIKLTSPTSFRHRPCRHGLLHLPTSNALRIKATRVLTPVFGPDFFVEICAMFTEPLSILSRCPAVSVFVCLNRYRQVNMILYSSTQPSCFLVRIELTTCSNSHATSIPDRAAFCHVSQRQCSTKISSIENKTNQPSNFEPRLLRRSCFWCSVCGLRLLLSPCSRFSW